jgi:TolB-like protein
VPDLLERLKERKLFQWALAYAAGSWVALQVLDVVADPWGLSDAVVRGAQAALVVGFFVVLVLAWYHGEQGRQRVSGPELLLIAGILIVSGLLYSWSFGPGDTIPDGVMRPVPGEGVRADDELVALPSGPTVAVLPFANLSGDPEQEYFSDGLSEDISTELSRFRDLFVIAGNSTFRYKGQAVDVREVARELGAHYVLEGSVRREGTSLRVTAQLLDASDGTHLWAETYDRDLSTSSIFTMQDEITERIIGTIASDHGVISRARFEEVRGRAPDDLAAYECVLLARAYYRDNSVPSEHEGVHSCLERAVRNDPGYADAWTYLTWLILDEHRFGYHPRPDPLDRALRAAQRAVESDPTSARAHNALAAAHLFRHEIDRFVAEADRALALNPNDAVVLAILGELFIILGDDERGIALMGRAMALEPNHPTWFNFGIATYHFNREEYEEALVAARRLNIPGYFWVKIQQAAIYGQLGRQDEARTAVEELLSLYPGFTLQTAYLEFEKTPRSDRQIERWVAGLRKAGVPE